MNFQDALVLNFPIIWVNYGIPSFFNWNLEHTTLWKLDIHVISWSAVVYWTFLALPFPANKFDFNPIFLHNWNLILAKLLIFGILHFVFGF